MALSEEEQRLLRALELSLSADDPELASTLSGTSLAGKERRLMAVAVLGMIAGLTIVFTGAFLDMAFVGVIGFIVMVVCAYGAVSLYQRRGISVEAATATKEKKSSMIDRFEDRWNRRGDDLG